MMYGRIWLVVVCLGLGWAGPVWSENELARINDRVLTVEEFEQKLGSMAPQLRAHYSDPEGRLRFLEELITQEVIFQESLRLGLQKDQAVQAKLEDARRSILVNAFFEKLLAERLGQEQIRTYYGAHQQDFKQIKASHILVQEEKEAQEVYRKIQDGANFAELAKELSTDQSTRQRGGDLGFFPRGAMVPSFEQAAFSLKVNEVSQPVHTEFGYHIIKVVAVRDAKVFKELTDEDLDFVKRKMVNDEIEHLKAEAKVVVHQEQLGRE